jgi:hypothetical protein
MLPRPPDWQDGEQPRSRDDLLAMLRGAMTRSVHYLSAEELHALAEGVLRTFRRHGVGLRLKRPWRAPQPLPNAHASRLGDCRWPVVQVACGECGRAGQFRVGTLLERFGEDLPMTELARRIASDCPRVRESIPGSPCRATLPQFAADHRSYLARKERAWRR